MRPWAIGLLLLTLTTHLGFSWWEPWFTPARAFYVLRGIEGAMLFLSLALLSRSLLVAITALVGGTMESLTAICGAAFYWGKGPAKAQANGLLCDAAHPQPVAWIAIAVCIAVLLIVRRHAESDSP